MKASILTLLLFTFSFIFSCGNSDKSTEKQLELEKQKLELEKEKLKLEQEKVKSEPEEKSEVIENQKEKATSSTNNYTGEFYDSKVKGTMTFKNKKVEGSFYDVSDPMLKYSIEGTNYKDGEIEVAIYYQGKHLVSGRMTKTLTKTYVIWEGEMEGKQDITSLTLKRPR